MKISIIVCVISIICGYIIMKRRIEKFHGMYEAVTAFCSKIITDKNKPDTSLWFLYTCFILSYVCMNYMAFHCNEVNKIFQPLKLNIYLYHHIPITGFALIFSIYSCNYLIYELCDNYYNTLEFSNKIIKKYLKYKPDFVIRYKVLEVIKNFDENEKDFKLIVYPMRKILFILIVTINIACLTLTIFLVQLNVDYISKLLWILIIFPFDLYFFYTQIKTYFKSEIQRKLLFNIEKWINSSDDSFVGKIITSINLVSQQSASISISRVEETRSSETYI